jgi:hypothetical protein
VQRISSGFTFLMKRVFPIFWFGILATVTITMLINREGAAAGALAMIVVVPLAMAAIAYVIMRRLFFDLVDEVWDAGDALIVKNGSMEIRVALADVVGVDFSKLSNPERATLTLRNQTQLGTKISFLAPTRWINIGTHPLKTELEQRVAQAREQ